MREHMIHDSIKENNYEDYKFRNSLKSNKNEYKNPFLLDLRKTISKNHFNFLNTQFNISKYILQKIQVKEYTKI